MASENTDDLTAWFKDKFEGDLVEGALEPVKFEGKYYGVPVDAWTYTLYYNVDMFKEAGIAKPPETWEELAEYAQKLKKGDQWGISLTYDWRCTYLPFVYQNGGAILNKDGTKAVINATEAVEAIQFWHDLFNKYKVTPVGNNPPEATMVFKQGKAAMMIVGPWEIPGCKEAGINFKTTTLQSRKYSVSEADSHVVAIYSKTSAEKKEAAKTFIEFFMKRESNLIWIIDGGKVPTKKSIINSAEFKNAELLTPFAQMNFQYFPKTTIAGVIDTALSKAMGEIVVNHVPVQVALDEAAETINNELKQQ